MLTIKKSASVKQIKNKRKTGSGGALQNQRPNASERLQKTVVCTCRKGCPFISCWTAGTTRVRGRRVLNISREKSAGKKKRLKQGKGGKSVESSMGVRKVSKGESQDVQTNKS